MSKVALFPWRVVAAETKWQVVIAQEWRKMISVLRMESPRSNPKPPTRERELPKQVTLGRTLLVLAGGLAVVLIAGTQRFVSVSSVAVAVLAFPVLVELRSLSRAASSLAGEPWGVDAVSLLTASACVVGLAQVHSFSAWATAWLIVVALGALGRRATRRT